MRATTLLRKLLDQKHAKVTGLELGDEGLVVEVAPTTRVPRCGGCCRRAPRVYDDRERLWRHLDFAGMRVDLRYRIRRVQCACCGVTTELVPWAEPGSWFTRDFEDMVALLAQKMDKSSICQLMGVAWQTVGAIMARVVARRGPDDLLDDLSAIGIDEISYKRHHRYLTVVTDQIRNRVVWVGEGRRAETLAKFFVELGKERSEKLLTVCIDMAGGYLKALAQFAPYAVVVFDRFHVQRLVQDAVDEVRREQVRELARSAEGRAIKHTRWALQKRPWNVTVSEQAKLVDLQRTNRPLFRAYMLKETLCEILDRRQHYVAARKLREWIGWALRSRLTPFRKAATTIKQYLSGILAYITTRLSNGLSEGMNSKIRVATKQAYGFRSADGLKAMIHLRCSGIAIPVVRHYPAAQA